jgi:hypothetical protein
MFHHSPNPSNIQPTNDKPPSFWPTLLSFVIMDTTLFITKAGKNQPIRLPGLQPGVCSGLILHFDKLGVLSLSMGAALSIPIEESRFRAVECINRRNVWGWAV